MKRGYYLALTSSGFIVYNEPHCSWMWSNAVKKFICVDAKILRKEIKNGLYAFIGGI